MVIHEYGDNSLPKIVLLHPMLADARCMLRLTESMEGRLARSFPICPGRGRIPVSMETPNRRRIRFPPI